MTTFSCKATGDFRKAMCEFTAVIDDLNDDDYSDLCADDPDFYNTAKISGKFILDQFDADKGVTKVMQANFQCCDYDTPFQQGRPVCQDSVLPIVLDNSLTDGEINYQLTMLPVPLSSSLDSDLVLIFSRSSRPMPNSEKRVAASSLTTKTRHISSSPSFSC